MYYKQSYLARKGAHAVPHRGADGSLEGFAVRLETASQEVLAFIPAPILAQANALPNSVLALLRG